MGMFFVILASASLALCGCHSDGRDQALVRPWGAETTAALKSRFDPYQHILVARVDERSWEDLGPHRLTPYHFKATVVKSYKGDWRVSERISFVHHVDSTAPTGSATNWSTGELVFITTREHTTNEISLDTGEWGHYSAELAPALEHLYPQAD